MTWINEKLHWHRCSLSSPFLYLYLLSLSHLLFKSACAWLCPCVYVCVRMRVGLVISSPSSMVVPSSWISSLSTLWRVQVHLFFFTSDPQPSTPQNPLWTLFTGDSNETAVHYQHLLSPFLFPFSTSLKKPISDNTSRLDALFRVGIVKHNTRKHCELTISGNGAV